MTHPIEASALRVGMFIHLNVGWMSHPFPLSSFKITSAEQIETIRALRLARMTWSPERSDPDARGAAAPGATGVAATTPGDPDAEADAARLGEAAATAADVRQDASRSAIGRQRDIALRCERQFNEACRDLRRTNDKVMSEPAAAHADAQQLAGALLDKMLVDGEPCLRVLGEMAGDRAAAHAMNVTVISLLLARQIAVPRPVLMELGVGALMHDVGKMALPDRVRLGREDFNANEAALYRDHVAQGLILARRMGLSAEAQLVIAQHHEHADGSGYPSALMLARMSLSARIVALVNRYDNLCNASTPAQSITPHEALSRLFAQCRSKFDESLLGAFIKMMGIYPPGSIVQLSDERFAMVMTVNAAHPLKPRVLVYDPDVPAEDAVHLDLEGYPLLGIRRSLRPVQLPARAADYLKPRQRVAYFFDVESVTRDGVREEVPA
jgi:putative nucleotidyltransferase with HDIG domain